MNRIFFFMPDHLKNNPRKDRKSQSWHRVMNDTYRDPIWYGLGAGGRLVGQVILPSFYAESYDAHIKGRAFRGTVIHCVENGDKWLPSGDVTERKARKRKNEAALNAAVEAAYNVDEAPLKGGVFVELNVEQQCKMNDVDEADFYRAINRLWENRVVEFIYIKRCSETGNQLVSSGLPTLTLNTSTINKNLTNLSTHVTNAGATPMRELPKPPPFEEMKAGDKFGNQFEHPIVKIGKEREIKNRLLEVFPNKICKWNQAWPLIKNLMTTNADVVDQLELASKNYAKFCKLKNREFISQLESFVRTAEWESYLNWEPTPEETANAERRKKESFANQAMELVRGIPEGGDAYEIGLKAFNNESAAKLLQRAVSGIRMALKSKEPLKQSLQALERAKTDIAKNPTGALQATTLEAPPEIILPEVELDEKALAFAKQFKIPKSVQAKVATDEEWAALVTPPVEAPSSVAIPNIESENRGLLDSSKQLETPLKAAEDVSAGSLGPFHYMDVRKAPGRVLEIVRATLEGVS